MTPTLTLIAVFAVFIPALLLPGPDFVAVARSSIAHGARCGVITAVGVTVGQVFYAGLSLLGLSALMIEHHWLAWAVRVLGGAYLVYLGLTLLLARRQALTLEAAGAPASTEALAFGFLVTLTNPKAVVLFASVFATAVTPATPVWVMAAMVLLVAASCLIWYSLVAMFLAAPAVAARLSAARRWIERAAGVCFIGFGGKVLADSRTPISP